jgi:hypothetical protein
MKKQDNANHGVRNITRQFNQLVVPSPVMFGMALPDSDNLRISPDKN